MKGITLHKGEPHINSGDAAAMHCGMFGMKNYVLQVGEQLRYNKVTNNTIRVYSGEGMINGRHFRILPNEYTEFTIENGNQGVKRRDLLVVRYEKLADGKESIAPVVIKGAAASNPSDPAYNRGDVYEGDTIVDFPLYRVTLDGINISTIEKLFDVLPSLSSVWPVGSIYMSVNSTDPGMLFGGTWVRFGEGRVLVSVTSGDTDFNASGKTGGEKAHTLTSGELASHSHGLNNHTHVHGNHSHTVGGESAQHTHNINLNTQNDGMHYHELGYDTDGNKFASGDKNYRRVLDYSDFRTGTVTVSNGKSAHRHQVTGSSAAENAVHTHSVTGGANGNTGGATGNTANTGANNAHNNMPPYITCYMWKRTA
jgi:microcystin-dependent protein|uniref:Baseplate wedge protein n=1 Tax=Siphoviridae sp. ctWDo30 TaxID=2826360 RepID=A0A8S5N5W9_9CAUD|nr:MAG TPA: baseplate wedge protein [Siphoviridae sp. ctWDo30]